MAKEIEAAPDYRSVMVDDQLHSFSHMMEMRIALSENIKEMEEQKKDLDTQITTLMTEVGAPKLQYAGRPVSITQGSRSTLSKEKLLLAGVAATTIAAATVETKFTYLLVGKQKE